MTTRQTALEAIRIECAQEGRITQYAIRTYTEHRIGSAAFREAAEAGIRQYQARQRAETPAAS